MKKRALAALAASFLVTLSQSNAKHIDTYWDDHATDLCLEVRETDDDFLALRQFPTTRSKILRALRPGDELVSLGKFRNGWAKVGIRMTPRMEGKLPPERRRAGWVYAEYTKVIECVDHYPGTIPGLPPPQPADDYGPLHFKPWIPDDSIPKSDPVCTTLNCKVK